MPELTPFSLLDAAHATSTANAMPVSLGVDALPVFDPNIAWDVANRKQTLKGQDAGVGGDRHAIQTSAGVDLTKVDASGTLHHNFGAGGNPSSLCRRIVPPDPALTTGHWHETVAAYDSTIGDGTLDVVHSFGWNDANNSALYDPTKPTFVIAMEGHFLDSVHGGAQFEGHLFQSRLPISLGGRAVRVFSASVNKGNLATTIVQQARFWLVQEDAATARPWVIWTTDQDPTNPSNSWQFCQGASNAAVDAITANNSSVTHSIGDGTHAATLALRGVQPQLTLQSANVDVMALKTSGVAGDSRIAWRDIVSVPNRDMWVIDSDSTTDASKGYLGGRLKVGDTATAPVAALDVLSTNASNPVAILRSLQGQADGLLEWWGKTSTGVDARIGAIDGNYVDNTNGSQKGRMAFYVSDSASGYREFMKAEANGGAPKISFYGGATVTRPSGDVAAGLMSLGLMSSAVYVLTAPDASTPAAAITGLSGQTADLVTVKAADTTTLFRIGPGGAFAGRKTTLTWSATIAVDVAAGNVHDALATSDATINASGVGMAAQKLEFIIANDGTSPRTVTFGTNFLPAGTLVGTINKTATITFTSNGFAWYETSRTTGL